jgi:hypothetical protein
MRPRGVKHYDSFAAKRQSRSTFQHGTAEVTARVGKLLANSEGFVAVAAIQFCCAAPPNREIAARIVLSLRYI